MTTTTSNNNGGFSNLADVLTRFTNQKAASQLLPACDLITNIDDGKYSGLNRLEFIKFPRYRTLGLLKTNSRSSQQYDITIVTQLSLGRLSLLPDLCKSWPQGSISAAIYIDSVPALFSIEEELTKLERETAPYCQITTSLLLSLELSAILTKIEYLALSSSTTDSEETITKSTITTTNTITCHPYDLLYPINALRNLALDASETDLVLSLDADFIFSKEAYAYLTSKNVFNMMRRTMSFSPTAFVVAAFEFRTSESWSKTGMSSSLLSLDPDQVVDQSSSRAARSGIDRRMLEKLCISMDIIPFHSRVVLNHEDDGDNNINDHEDRLLSREWVAKWCRGEVLDYHIKVTEIQFLTNFTKWFRSGNNVYKVQKLERYYEPYYVALKSQLPRFDERFRGYGFNKRQHNIELQYMGFEFQVLPEKVFAVHRWHKSSDSKKKLSGIVKASVGRAYEEFLSDVMRRYKGHGGRRRVNGVNAGRVGGRGGDPATLAAGLQSFMHFL